MIEARRAGAAALASLGLCGCANEQPPPGTLPDQDPPRVESISPAPDSVIQGFDGSVRLRFDEPVRSVRDLPQRLVASPFETWEVEWGFSDVRIRPRDGWRDSVVYCMEIPEGISDLLNNRTVEPTSFCFSTGVRIADTRISGTVLDRVTGQPETQARVLFLAPGDSTPYGAVSGTDGRFELRALPPGSYESFGFVDQNRNLRLDRALEPYDSATVLSSEAGAADLEFRLVEPDTTPPLLLRAEVADAVTLRLEFDDPLERPQPGAPSVTVRDSASGTPLELLGFAVGEPGSVDLPRPDSAERDSLTVGPGPIPAAEADSAVADSVGVPPGPVVETQLPSRFVTVRLAAEIPAGVYRVLADGFLNLRNLVGGGDTTFVAEASDSGEAPVDSAAVRDTVGTPPDSAAVSRDTTRVPPDTTAAPPDTVAVPGDTTSRRSRATSPPWNREEVRP